MFGIYELPRFSLEAIFTILLINVVGVFAAKALQLAYRRYHNEEKAKEVQTVKSLLHLFDEVQGARRGIVPVTPTPVGGAVVPR